MTITKSGRGAVVRFTENDAGYLASILSYARNADVNVDGSATSQRRGRKMLFALAALAESLDADAECYFFRLSSEGQISDAERAEYCRVRKLFDPAYGDEA
jgi:hypothetical protein